WSLIAGRIPGRTANDVKNYWNTHLRKKVMSFDKLKHVKKTDEKVINVKSNIIKPRPRTFTKQLPLMNKNINGTTIASNNTTLPRDVNTVSEPPVLEETKYWWESLLDDSEADNQGFVNSIISNGLDWEPNITNFSMELESDQQLPEPKIRENNASTSSIFVEDGHKKFWTDFIMDMEMNLWDPTSTSADKEMQSNNVP
ncbi:hypothetical protein TorRG33x02_191430, partial [Trema orientale]